MSQLIFESAVSSLLKAAAGKVKPETEVALGKLGLRFGARLDPAYPAEVWASAVRLIAKDLFPTEEDVEAHRLVARLTLQHFGNTTIGSALFAMARLIGADRSLRRMSHTLRTGSNFIQTDLVDVDANTKHLWVSDVTGVPGFYLGLIRDGSEFIGMRAYDIRILRTEGPGCRYELIRRAR